MNDVEFAGPVPFVPITPICAIVAGCVLAATGSRSSSTSWILGPMRVVILHRATMAQIGVIGTKGTGAGEFDIVHHIAADSKGNVYTAEIVNNRRAQRFVLKAK